MVTSTVIQRPIGDSEGEWKIFNETDTSVSMVTSHLSVTTTEDGTKREFITDRREILSMKTGRLEAYRYQRFAGQGKDGKDKHRMTNVTASLLHDVDGWGVDSAERQMRVELYKLAPEWMVPKDKDPMKIAQLAFPMLRVQNSWQRYAANNDLARPMRLDNAREFTTLVYGEELYRKDLMKAVSDSYLDLVYFAQAFSGLVPPDWMTTFLNGTPNPRSDRRSPLRMELYEIKKARHLIRRLPEKVRRALLTNENNFDRNGLSYASEAVNYMANLRRDFPGSKFEFSEDLKTWSEIYDRCSIIYRDLRNKPRRIPQTSQAKAVDKAEPLPGYKLLTAKRTTEMTKWGDDMGHCIGGYTDRAVAGRRTYLGLYHEDKLIANIEIYDNGRIGQFYGKYNRSLETWLTYGISDFIEQKTISDESYRQYGGYLEKAKEHLLTEDERKAKRAKEEAEKQAKLDEANRARAVALAARAQAIANGGVVELNQFANVAQDTAERIQNAIQHIREMTERQRAVNPRYADQMRFQRLLREEQEPPAFVANQHQLPPEAQANYRLVADGGLVAENRIEIIGFNENAVQNRIDRFNQWEVDLPAVANPFARAAERLNAPAVQPVVAQMFAGGF